MKRAPLYSLLALSLIAMIALGSPTAAAVDVNGWERNTGPGFDLYITPSPEVNLQELALMVNFGASDLALKVTNANRTVYSAILSPQSSDFLVLEFPDLDTYQITVSRDGDELLTLSKTRVSWMLPPPNDSGWNIRPPAVEDPKTWTDAMVNALITSLTLQVLLIASAAALIGLLVGAGVKKLTLFLAPTDFVTFSILVASISDLAFNWIGLGIGLYHVPFLGGYVLGFLLAYVPYVEAHTSDIGQKTMVIRPVVIYSPNDQIGMCIQQQNNKALIKRLCGIHHRLGTDAGLTPDWATSVKAPWLPKIRKMAVMIEEEVTEYEEVPFLHFFTARKYTTQWRLSNGSKLPKHLWAKSSGTIIWARDLIDRIYTDLVTERQRNKMLATQVAAEMHTYTVDRSTHRAIYDQFSKPVPPLTVQPTNENVMRPAARAMSAPQSVPKDVEPDAMRTKRIRPDEFEDEAEPDVERSENEHKDKRRRD